MLRDPSIGCVATARASRIWWRMVLRTLVFFSMDIGNLISNRIFRSFFVFYLGYLVSFQAGNSWNDLLISYIWVPTSMRWYSQLFQVPTSECWWFGGRSWASWFLWIEVMLAANKWISHWVTRGEDPVSSHAQNQFVLFSGWPERVKQDFLEWDGTSHKIGSLDAGMKTENMPYNWTSLDKKAVNKKQLNTIESTFQIPTS